MASSKKSNKFTDADMDEIETSLSESAIFRNATSTQVVKPDKPQVHKYTTHLRADTIKAIRVYAASHDIKDYELAQSIFDKFFEENKEG